MSNKFVNLTPHAIVVVRPSGATIGFTPSGDVARVSTQDQVVAVINGIEISTTSYGEVVGLPEPQPGVIFLVSALVRQAMPNRFDVVSPGGLIRDAQGQPVGCTGFVANTRNCQDPGSHAMAEQENLGCRSCGKSPLAHF